jgi:predicted nucleic acid-binding protein
MTSNGERWACDTSVAVAALDPAHQAHADCRRVLLDERPAIAGHAFYETYSVLTRLPVDLRLSAAQATEVLRAAFPRVCWLDAGASDALRERLGEVGVVGGSVYDALVGEAARANEHSLFTRDRRAERTYRALDVRYEFVG